MFNTKTYGYYTKFWIGVGVIAVLLIVPKVKRLVWGGRANGHVVEFQLRRSIFEHHYIPVIQFETEQKTVRFKIKSEMDYSLHEQVPVIYNVHDPEEADVYSFWGFYFETLLQIPLYSLIWLVIYTSLPFLFMHQSELDQKTLNKLNKMGFNQTLKRRKHIFTGNPYAELSLSGKNVFRGLYILLMMVGGGSIVLTVWQLIEEAFPLRVGIVVIIMIGVLLYFLGKELKKI